MELNDVFWGNTIGRWLTAVGVLVVALLFLRILRGAALATMRRVASKTQTSLDDLAVDVLQATSWWLMAVVSLFGASLVPDLNQTLSSVIYRAALIALFLQGGIWGSAALASWSRRYIQGREGLDGSAVTTMTALSVIGRIFVWALVLLLALDNLGVEVTALLAGLGVGGVAAALAAQSTLGDLFAALSIFLDKPFAIGDFVSAGAHSGTIEHVGMKTTRIRSLTGEQVVVGNSDLLNDRIRNLGRMVQRRVALEIGVVYDTPLETLRAIPTWIEEIVTARPRARFDRAHLTEHGPYSINFQAVYYVEVPDFEVYMDVRQEVALTLHEKFESEGVEFAYPTQVVYTRPVP